MGGDFNVTRIIQERFPIGRQTRGMRKFNKFIEDSNLFEIPLSNGKFTWSGEGNTISKSLLDRFLINSEWDDLFADTSATRKA